MSALFPAPAPRFSWSNGVSVLRVLQYSTRQFAAMGCMRADPAISGGSRSPERPSRRLQAVGDADCTRGGCPVVEAVHDSRRLSFDRDKTVNQLSMGFAPLAVLPGVGGARPAGNPTLGGRRSGKRRPLDPSTLAAGSRAKVRIEMSSVLSCNPMQVGWRNGMLLISKLAQGTMCVQSMNIIALVVSVSSVCH